MQWGGGGGGCCAAVANGAAAIVAGLADCVVVFRSLAQGAARPLRTGRRHRHRSRGETAYLMPYGVLAPPQRFAMRVQRFMHEHGVRQEALRAIAHGLLPPRAGQPARA